MTSLNRTDLKAKFENGDAPQGSDFSDLIDSFVSLADTSVQTMQGGLAFSGTVSAATINAGTGTFTGIVSAAGVWATNADATTISAQTATFTTLTGPSSGVNVTSTLNMVGATLRETVTSVACISSTQASGYVVTNSINIIRTVSTGQSDALVMPFYAGARFVFINNTTASAQLFPPSGGAFDGGSTNAKIDIGPKGGSISRAVVYCESSVAAHSIRGTN